MHDAGIWLPAAIEPPGTRRRTGPRGEAPESGAPESGARQAHPDLPGHGPRAATAIDARGVTFAYEPGQPAVRGVSLAIQPGERVALVGPNGGGKSTLARLLVGLLRPDRGTVRLGGDDPARLRAAELARRAAYVFQDPERQFLAERVGDEIMLGLDASRRGDAESLMASLGLPLERFAARSPFRLSGGEARRLSLAIALVRDPGVLVLDEPTFGQDRGTYDGLLDILAGHLRAGATLIAATHDERFVADVADRVITMSDGRITADERRPMMLGRLELGDAQLDSALGRTSPVVKLGGGGRLAGRPGVHAGLGAAAVPRRRGDRGRDPARLRATRDAG